MFLRVKARSTLTLSHARTLRTFDRTCTTCLLSNFTSRIPVPRPRSSAYGTLSISRRVKDALQNRQPVVCLESTIITHGMEYPANLRMARAVEKVIEDNGAIPATIAVLNGTPHVGLEDNDLEFLARTGKQARKISRRDLASSLADSATGGTTVSGTMILAKMAGIKVFVTGGIGGVHREAQQTMDISNDLNELSRNDVAVVCAGPKAILDIPLTLEYLETMGVTVTTIGQQNLPAFYSSDSGIKSPQVSPNAEHAARLIDANHRLALGSSVLVCVPIPDSSSIDAQEMRLVIDKALTEAKTLSIQGKDSTPFLLGAVSKATAGRSLEANIDLVLENARIGAQIAVHLASIGGARKSESSTAPTSNKKSPLIDPDQAQILATSLFNLEEGFSLQTDRQSASVNKAKGFEQRSTNTDVLVVGGVAVDLTCSVNTPLTEVGALLYTSTPGMINRTVGGVAGNIARSVASSNVSVSLASVIGSSSSSGDADVDGQFILDKLEEDAISLKIATIPKQRSAVYTCIQAKGELLAAVADMQIFNHAFEALKDNLDTTNYKAIIIDANIPAALDLLENARAEAQIVCFEPTSVKKSATIFEQTGINIGDRIWPNNLVSVTTPNIHELQAMFLAAKTRGIFETQAWWKVINALDIAAAFRMQVEHFLRARKDIKQDLAGLGAIQQAIQLLPIFQNIYLTLGSSGVISFHLSDVAQMPAETEATLTQKGQGCTLQITYHKPVASPSTVISDTGAGDTFTGVLISNLVQRRSIPESVQLAQEAAILTLQSSEAVAAAIKQ